MAEQLKVGGEVDAWCTHCKLMKWHTIVALVGTKPAKVECNGCHKQHQFRAAPPGTPAPGGASSSGTTRKPRATKAAAAAPPVQSYDEVLAGRSGEAKTYSPNEKYALGDVVRHPTFEVGVVTATPAPQKIEIAFRDGRKILLHDRGGAVPSKLGPAPRRDESAGPTGTPDSPHRR